jgi:ribosome-binding ATPase YchF (GTP1/OBG family)
MEYSTLERWEGISETGIIYDQGSLYARFEQLSDPRKARGKRYSLVTLLVIMSGRRSEVHTAVVNVPDHRIDEPSQLFHPKATTYAKVAYTDIAGLEGSARGDIAGPLLTQLSQMDGFIHVVHCFDNPNVSHVFGDISPQRNIDQLEDEFMINDLIQVKCKLTRLADEKTRGSRDRTEIGREMTIFERLHSALSESIPLRKFEPSPGEMKIISGFGFLSLKQLLIILNLGEGQ